MNNQEMPTHALIDCGATGIAFMHKDFARHHQIPVNKLLENIPVEVIDGMIIESGDIMHIATVGMKIQDHGEQLPMFITKLGHYPTVPGIPWLRLHDGAVQCVSNTVPFGSQNCTTHCHYIPETVQEVTNEPPEQGYSARDIFEPQMWLQTPFQGNIVTINGGLFFRTVNRGKLTIFWVSLYNITNAIEAKDLKKPSLEEIVPEQYHEFLPLFSKVLVDQLPPHWPGINYEVILKVGETPTWGPLYSMSRAELVVLKEWLVENMLKGFIWHSSLPFAAPVLFTKERDGGLRFFINYRDINSKTLHNQYPLPLIKETVNLLGKARIWTKLDVRGAYNFLRV